MSTQEDAILTVGLFILILYSSFTSNNFKINILMKQIVAIASIYYKLLT